MKRKKKVDKKCVFNVWLEVEQIDESNDINGLDLSAHKLAQFSRYKDAEEYVEKIIDEAEE